MGNRIKKRAGSSGTGILAVKQLYHTWLDPIIAPHTMKTEVESNKLILTRKSPTKCLGLVLAKQLQPPLETIFPNISQPFFKGITKAINPNVTYSTVQMSEQEGIETIELP